MAPCASFKLGARLPFKMQLMHGVADLVAGNQRLYQCIAVRKFRAQSGFALLPVFYPQVARGSSDRDVAALRKASDVC